MAILKGTEIMHHTERCLSYSVLETFIGGHPHTSYYTATTLFATVVSLRSLLLFVPLWVLWSLGFSSVLHTRGSCSISALASKSASRVSSRSRRRCANRSSLSSSEPDCECAARFRSIAVMVSSETASGSVIRGGAGSSK